MLNDGDRMSGHFLIVEARFYEALADAQMAGAIRALEAAGASYERVSVPGAWKFLPPSPLPIPVRSILTAMWPLAA